MLTHAACLFGPPADFIVVLLRLRATSTARVGADSATGTCSNAISLMVASASAVLPTAIGTAALKEADSHSAGMTCRRPHRWNRLIRIADRVADVVACR